MQANERECVVKIEGEVVGNLSVKSIRLYGESGTRMANVGFKVKVDVENAAERFGEDFLRVAFGGMREVEKGRYEFACGSLDKPRLVCELHEIEILGHRFRATPESPKITPVDGEPRVVVDFVLPLPCEGQHRDAIGDIAINCGKTIKITWWPKQLDLPLNGAEPEADADAEPAVVNTGQGAFGNPTPKLF